jgi:hypothetical protein
MQCMSIIINSRVDKIWQMWQGCLSLDGAYAGSTAQVLDPFGTPVSDTFSTTSGEFCYTYSRSAIDDTLKIQCKSDWLQGWIKSLIATGAVNVTSPITTNGRIATVKSINLPPL